ncbi:unnamed protein product [Paramecium primaurelia]|uniref:Uncharacterized protein n=1 Tax=Paramecium primaurelia TaxID=5886 RepID=A0A8S1LB55_PARPR|nr:unnamed protein product [Paramecium primaurelia]
MGFGQIQKQPLNQLVQITSDHPDAKFTYFSDIVFQTEQIEIIIDKVVKEDDKFIYFLDMKHLCQNNQRILNNFSVLKSQYQTIVCLLVFEQNQFSIVFP